MAVKPDLRFRSFLWSQTRARELAQTRLSLSDPIETSTQPSPEPAAAPPPAAPSRSTPAARAKGTLTPLEKAVMRLSEHCVSDSTGAHPTPVPAPDPVHPDPAKLHVNRQTGPLEGIIVPQGRLNVRANLDDQNA